MRSISLILMALCALSPLTSRAQYSTNTPATEIENFEMQPDAVIVKGFDNIGSITTEAGVISVRCKESDNVTAGTSQYAIAVTFESDQSRTRLLVDYDEMDALIRGLDFLSKITYSVTTMPGFDATFTTRSGFCVAAHSDRRQGAIQQFLQFDGMVRVPLTPDQFSQFQNLIGQAKTSLDATRSKNSGQ